jgi:predicted small metal-binding protein
LIDAPGAVLLSVFEISQMGEQTNPVELIVRCECGFEARGQHAEVIAAVQQHGREAHNMEATPEQVLAMARPA